MPLVAAQGLAQQHGAEHWFRYATDLAAVALAYDASRGKAASGPAAVRQALEQEISRVAAIDSRSRSSLFLPEYHLHDLSGSDDPRLMSLRASAALATLLLLAEDPGNSSLQHYWQICHRSLERGLHLALGEHGSPLVIVPMMKCCSAWRRWWQCGNKSVSKLCSAKTVC